jgi:hypothetical protein
MLLEGIAVGAHPTEEVEGSRDHEGRRPHPRPHGKRHLLVLRRLWPPPAASSPAPADRYRFVGVLNSMNQEVVRSLSFNRHRRSILTISVYSFDNWSTLHVRSTPYE